MQFIKNISVWPKKGFLDGPGLKKEKSTLVKLLKVVYGALTYNVTFKMSNYCISIGNE